jgi:hypothetical protein
MSVDLPVGTSRGWKAPAVTVVCTLLLAIGLTWTFFAMRAVMNVGGACADGGPYVSAQPCPDGAILIAIAVPVMLISAMVGSAGWNFLEYAFKGPDVVWAWLFCGVLFWLMAAPAAFGVLVGLKNAVVPPDPPPPGTGSRWWVPVYAALGAIGFLIGAWTFNALS